MFAEVPTGFHAVCEHPVAITRSVEWFLSVISLPTNQDDTQYTCRQVIPGHRLVFCNVVLSGEPPIIFLYIQDSLQTQF